MNTKSYLLLIGLTVILTVTVPLTRTGNAPENRAPLPRPAVVYRDDRQEVVSDGDDVVVRNLADGTVCRPGLKADEIRSVTRLHRKSAGELPLLGEFIEDGLKLAGAERTVIVRTVPETAVITVHPQPHTADDKIIIDKSTHRLFYYRRGELAKSYPVATGRLPEYTPEGTFHIANKIGHPLPDDPEGRFGPRWMGLAVPCEQDHRRPNDPRAPVGQKYGIHGTNEPESIGSDASGGCIRLRNEDAVELFDLVSLGTAVEIRR